MKPICIALVVFLSAFLCVPLYAHDGHTHTVISVDKALRLATQMSEKMTQKDQDLGVGKLADSWAGLPSEHIKLHEKRDGNYLISIFNAQEDKTLYILMTDSGKLQKASFSKGFHESSKGHHKLH